MKLRRIISLFLLAVYLILAVGPAALSLSCECVAMGAHARHAGLHASGCCAHACCAADASADSASARASVAAPCCDDRHSTEIELYTGLGSETEKHARCIVVHLPAALAAESSCPARIPTLRRRPVERSVSLPADPSSGTPGLRAPPVLV